MIGLLGGTFDPIHCGHLDVARTARQALGLDVVHLIPAHIPPHRSAPRASAAHRFAMASAAVAGEQGLVVSDLEMETIGPSYTIDTLDRLERSGVRAGLLCFITGADAFKEITSWKAHDELLSRCAFAVVSRPGLSALSLRDTMPDLADRMIEAGAFHPTSPPSIALVDAATSPVSSTDVRRAIEGGRSLTGLVPPAVAAHIARHGLYAPLRHDED
jgi:nicotinate-nucleotide adenylyltransferase